VTLAAELAAALRSSRGVAHKRDIDAVMRTFERSLPGGAARADVMIGDDCAAIPDAAGWLLFAIEGLIPEFVAGQPWFAGYCGVMVNISDVYAMGGRPLAVVDAIWSRDGKRARPLLEGMAAASAAYGVPIVGGHSNTRSDAEQLSVAVLGRAERLLTSFDAAPGDVLVAAVDLRGRYREPYPFWDASTGAGAARLRADLELLPRLAEAGLCAAGKDISMAGVLGTALMLLECSGVGAVVDVHAVPRPQEAALDRWLLATFPSFGFLLSVPEPAAAEVVARFTSQSIAAAAIGRCDASGRVRLRAGGEEALAWDFAQEPLIGCGPRSRLSLATAQ
jgi:AIR synthase-related protein